MLAFELFLKIKQPSHSNSQANRIVCGLGQSGRAEVEVHLGS